MPPKRNENAIKRALDQYERQPYYAWQQHYSNSAHKDAHLLWKQEQEEAREHARRVEREEKRIKDAQRPTGGKSKRLKTKRRNMKRRKTRNKN